LSTLAEIITKVVTENIKPDRFQEELINELDIPQEEAENTAKDVYKKILKPIESELEKSGINAKDVLNKSAQPTQKIMDIGSQKVEIKSAPDPTPKIIPATPKPVFPEQHKENSFTDIKKPIQTTPPPPAVPKFNPEPQTTKPSPEQKPVEEDKPFILHETKPLFTPTAPPQKPSVNFDPRPTFGFGDKEVSVDVESSDNKKSSDQKTRIVHYSD